MQFRSYVLVLGGPDCICCVLLVVDTFKDCPMGPFMGPVDSGGVCSMGPYLVYGMYWAGYVSRSRFGAHTRGP